MTKRCHNSDCDGEYIKTNSYENGVRCMVCRPKEQDYTPPKEHLDYEAVIREAENRRPDIDNWAADVRRELTSSNFQWVAQRLQEQHMAILWESQAEDIKFLMREFGITDEEMTETLDNPEFGGGALDVITGIVNKRTVDWELRSIVQRIKNTRSKACACMARGSNLEAGRIPLQQLLDWTPTYTQSERMLHEAIRSATAVIQKLDKQGNLTPNDGDACYELVQLAKSLPPVLAVTTTGRFQCATPNPSAVPSE